MRPRILFFIFAFSLSGCVTVETCDDDNASELVARFKTVKEEVTSDSLVSALTIYGIREGMADSLLYDSIPASGFVVPLNPHLGYSSFVLEIGIQSDTLTIHHQYETYMISYTCGFGNLFRVESIGHSNNMIINDTIISELVDAEYETDEEHIWIYL